MSARCCGIVPPRGNRFCSRSERVSWTGIIWYWRVARSKVAYSSMQQDESTVFRSYPLCTRIKKPPLCSQCDRAQRLSASSEQLHQTRRRDNSQQQHKTHRTTLLQQRGRTRQRSNDDDLNNKRRRGDGGTHLQ